MAGKQGGTRRSQRNKRRRQRQQQQQRRNNNIIVTDDDKIGSAAAPDVNETTRHEKTIGVVVGAKDPSSDDVPTTTTTTATDDGTATASTASATTAATTIRGQIRDLRADLRRVRPDGLAGNLLFWWLWPVKFAADPVFAALESVTAAPLTAGNVIVSKCCRVVRWTSHAAYGVLSSNAMGHLLSSSSDDDGAGRAKFMALSNYLALMHRADSAENGETPFRETLLRKAHETAGAVQFLVGANESSFGPSFVRHPQETLTMLWDGYGALYDYASKQEILDEIATMGGLRYAENKALLARIQRADLDGSIGKHRVFEMLTDDRKKSRARVFGRFPLPDLRYCVKFAVAAYGDGGIESSGLGDSDHTFDWRNGDWTAARVSEHTGIPEADLRMMDVAHRGGDPKQLRHFVAIDRANRKVVLAIRGAYTQKEAMMDFNGHSCEILGGEAHAAVAIMSERLWASIGAQVVNLLNRHAGFELIVTGHSLGGGNACLLNLILHRDERMRGRAWRAIAFASPPVYVPLSNVSVEAQTCVNVINQYDFVPFLSGDSVRHQMAMISTVDEAYSDSGMVGKAKVLLGIEKPDPELVQRIHNIQRQPLPVSKPGVPRGMSVPAMGNVWIWPKNDIEVDAAPYKAVIADSSKMSTTGLFIHKNDFTDHLPARYEYVLNHTT